MKKMIQLLLVFRNGTLTEEGASILDIECISLYAGSAFGGI
ncbi:hypothetical protein [Oryzifoliimicrobium ureilyticus]